MVEPRAGDVEGGHHRIAGIPIDQSLVTVNLLLGPAVEGGNLVGELIGRLPRREGGIAADVDEHDGHQPLGGLTDARRQQGVAADGLRFGRIDAEAAQLLPGIAGLQPVMMRGRLLADGP